jgi:hypothetical protein
MKTITNEKFIQRRVQLARRTSLIGMGVLIAGLVASFNQQYYYLSLPALVIGFILANISAYNANRYLKEPRPDQALTRALRGFDNNFRLFNYCSSIAHVLLTPSRLYALTVKLQDGQIRKEGGRWRRDFKLRRILFFFNEEALGNPTRDARDEAARLQQALQKILGEAAPPVEPLIVFTHPNAQLQVAESAPGENGDVPALAGGDLKKFLRAQPKGTPFTSEMRRQLAELLQGDVEVE